MRVGNFSNTVELKIRNEDTRGLLNDMKSQEGFSDYDFIAIAQRLPLSWRQPFSSIDKRAVCRTQVFEKVLTVT